MGIAQEVVTLGVTPSNAGFVNRAPRDFTVQGSADASAWATVLTVTNSTGWTALTERVFNVQ